MGIKYGVLGMIFNKLLGKLVAKGILILMLFRELEILMLMP
jgi:hypothetical protein